MKKIAILLFINSIAIFSCTKASDLINKNQLAGTWLLKQYDGGEGYRVIIPTDSITIRFNNENKFTSSANFNIPANGNYTITKDPDGYHYSNTVINLLSESSDQITYGLKLTQDSLLLFDGCCDMYRYTYIRLK